jgi:hypothetical protein
MSNATTVANYLYYFEGGPRDGYYTLVSPTFTKNLPAPWYDFVLDDTSRAVYKYKPEKEVVTGRITTQDDKGNLIPSIIWTYQFQEDSDLLSQAHEENRNPKGHGAYELGD